MGKFVFILTLQGKCRRCKPPVHTFRKNGTDVTKISAAEEEDFFRRQENKNTMSALLPWHV